MLVHTHDNRKAKAIIFISQCNQETNAISVRFTIYYIKVDTVFIFTVISVPNQSPNPPSWGSRKTGFRQFHMCPVIYIPRIIRLHIYCVYVFVGACARLLEFMIECKLHLVAKSMVTNLISSPVFLLLFSFSFWLSSLFLCRFLWLLLLLLLLLFLCCSAILAPIRPPFYAHTHTLHSHKVQFVYKNKNYINMYRCCGCSQSLYAVYSALIFFFPPIDRCLCVFAHILPILYHRFFVLSIYFLKFCTICITLGFWGVCVSCVCAAVCFFFALTSY